MKRAIYEWGAILTCALALSCLAFWAVSIYSDAADFKLSFGDRAQMAVSDGTITLSDDIESLKDFEDFDKGVQFYPPPVEHTRLTLPGLRFRSMMWGVLIYWLNISLLVPASLLAAAAVACFHRFRQLRLGVPDPRPLPENQAPHPLDDPSQ